MAPTFVSTLFSSRSGSETPFPTSSKGASFSNSTSSNTSANSNGNSSSNAQKNTLTSFRKFRASFSQSTASVTSSSSTSTSLSPPSSIDEEAEEASASNGRDGKSLKDSKSAEGLSASVPASYRCSLRPGTPLWGAVGVKLSKKNAKSTMTRSSTSGSVVVPSDTSYSSLPTQSSLHYAHIESEEYEDISPYATVTLNTLRRTLSRLSLNAPTINGRREKEGHATNSGSSPSPSLRSRSSPRLGRGSPRVMPTFRLPRMQSFSPNLRMNLGDEQEDKDFLNDAIFRSSDMYAVVDGDDTSEEEYNRGALYTSTISSVNETTTCTKSNFSSSITSSPMSRFGFSSTSSTATSSTTATDETRYAELANLISIIEHSPTLCRSPLSTAPNTPVLAQKKSFSFLSKSMSRSKLKTDTSSSPVILQSVPMARTNRNATLKKPKPMPVQQLKGELRLEKQSTNLDIPPPRPCESRSYSFPYPSTRPPPSEIKGTRLKSSRSLDDIVAVCSQTGLRMSRTQYGKMENHDMPHKYDYERKSRYTTEMANPSEMRYSYPALCTPPRTPQSRHASIEWFADIEDNLSYEGEGEEVVVACDESALMPAFLLRPVSMTIPEKEDVKKEEGVNVQVKHQSDAYDSLMDIIDSFPSPTIMTSSAFLSSSTIATSTSELSSPSSRTSNTSNPGSPSNSLWSFSQTVECSPSSSLATPASEVVSTPASSYFVGEDRRDDGAAEKIIEGSENKGKSYAKSNGGYVLASHRALTDMLQLSDRKDLGNM